MKSIGNLKTQNFTNNMNGMETIKLCGSEILDLKKKRMQKIEFKKDKLMAREISKTAIKEKIRTGNASGKLSKLTNIIYAYPEQNFIDWNKNNQLKEYFFDKLKMAASLALILALLISQTFAVSAFEAHAVKITAHICTSEDCSAPVSQAVSSEPECELSISKQVDKTTATPGDELMYILNFFNSGVVNCAAGKVEDAIDNSLEFINESHGLNISAGYNDEPLYQSSAGILLWSVGALAPGESGFISWTAKIKEQKSCDKFEIVNFGSVTSGEYSEFTEWVNSNEVRTEVSCGQNNSPESKKEEQSMHKTISTELSSLPTLENFPGKNSINNQPAPSPAGIPSTNLANEENPNIVPDSSPTPAPVVSPIIPPSNSPTVNISPSPYFTSSPAPNPRS